ncbi:MAG: hypothetical protein K2J99_17660 [Lachnospiraceae bacterium]|nr:hypothetical protein [Lachnospiraceae bacterium]
MTSKNSFWASSKENHKRRIWVWIITVLAQLMMYVGVLTVYLSRIRRWNVEGVYRTREEYQNALYQATKDALAFQDNLMPVLIVLAVIIGVQGFSYLYDRKKVDMYHSVPVDKNKRFAVVYINGMIIYLTAILASLLIGVIVAAVQGAVNGEVMAAIGLGFLWNLLFFMVVYHTVVLAVMLTGNRLITLCVTGMLIGYEPVLYDLLENMQYSFFETVSGFYVTHIPKLSVLYDYNINTWNLKQPEKVAVLAKVMLPYYGKWFILAVVLLIAAWLCYRKRPSEAAGKAVAFVRVEPFLKVFVAVPIGVCLGMWVHSAAYGNAVLTAVSMAGGGVIACAAIEVIYDFDIKSLFKHLVSSGAAIAAIIFIFLAFKMDLFGYDDYIPSADKLESIAVSVDYYGQFWDKEYNYVGASEFSEEHMHLQDVEPVLILADKARQENVEDMTDARIINVLYRLSSGRRVGRRFYVDFDNPVNEALMNRIVGTKEFKEGTYQIMTDQDSFADVTAMTYSNGATNVALPAQDAQMLREAYVKDMEKFDFTLAINNRPCGRIHMNFPNWFGTDLDVYDSFENTIAYLQSKEAYYPVELNAEDIADMTITNYHMELYENGDHDGEVDPLVFNSAVAAEASWVSGYADEGDTIVTETFTDEEDIAQIVPHIYPAYLSAAWNHSGELDDNYDIYITFKKDTTYPYDRSQYGVYYKFYTGQAPEFVEEATALDAGEE